MIQIQEKQEKQKKSKKSENLPSSEEVSYFNLKNAGEFKKAYGMLFRCFIKDLRFLFITQKKQPDFFNEDLFSLIEESRVLLREYGVDLNQNAQNSLEDLGIIDELVRHGGLLTPGLYQKAEYAVIDIYEEFKWVCNECLEMEEKTENGGEKQDESK